MHACSSRLAAILVCLAFALGSAAAAEHEERAHGHDASAHKLELDHGKKWSTDAPLRQGMSAIRDAVATEHHAIHHNKASLARYQALAGKVDEQVAYMVANCKLSPEADANLHIILADIIAGADLMKGKRKTKAREGAVKLIGALERYPEYFDHPGWRKLE
jgi:hypothetical protein